MAVGAFLALVAVLKMFDVEYAQFAEGVGKVTAVFAKQLKEKVNTARDAVSTLRGNFGAVADLSKGKLSLN
jgi:hypothetical protein